MIMHCVRIYVCVRVCNTHAVLECVRVEPQLSSRVAAVAIGVCQKNTADGKDRIFV